MSCQHKLLEEKDLGLELGLLLQQETNNRQVLLVEHRSESILQQKIEGFDRFQQVSAIHSYGQLVENKKDLNCRRESQDPRKGGQSSSIFYEFDKSLELQLICFHYMICRSSTN